MDISSFSFDKLLSHIIPGVILYFPINKVLFILGFSQHRDSFLNIFVFLLGVVLIIVVDGLRHVLIDPMFYKYFFEKINKNENSGTSILGEESFAIFQKSNIDFFKFILQETYSYYEFYCNLTFCLLIYFCFFILLNILNVRVGLAFVLFSLVLVYLAYKAFEVYIREINRSIKFPR